MAPAPIVIKCDCGVTTRGNSGDIIRCQGCGQRFNTEDDARRLEAVAAATQRRFKVVSRMGIGVVGLLALVGFFLFKAPGLAVGAAIGGGVWFGLVLPFMKKRLLNTASTKYKTTITASRK